MNGTTFHSVVVLDASHSSVDPVEFSNKIREALSFGRSVAVVNSPVQNHYGWNKYTFESLLGYGGTRRQVHGMYYTFLQAPR